MRLIRAKGKTPGGGLLSRLARDRKGNAIAMLAIALLPTAAFAGSAVDMSRLYVIRSRLQQACDAAALASRRVMVDDADHELDGGAKTLAASFFKNNFKDGWLGTRSTKSSFQESGTQQVVGSAETVAPMLMMGMFGVAPQTIKVECAARLDIPDVDLMLVLDTTGSMACPPSGPGSCGAASYSYTRSDGSTGYAVQEKSDSRMSGLREAVVDFWDAMDTYTDDRTNVRYGFVPYSSAVNVGKIMPSSYILNTKHTYQSRLIKEDEDYGSATNRSITGLNQSQCNAMAGRHTAADRPQPAAVKVFNTSGDAYRNTVTGWTAVNGGTCSITQQRLVPLWSFQPVDYEIKDYVEGRSVLDPTKYTNSYVKWEGCIEERPAPSPSSYDPERLPADMDPDLEPNTDARRWRPMWPNVIYNRYATAVANWPSEIGDQYFPPKYDNDIYPYYRNTGGDPRYIRNGEVSCGKQAQRLKKMTRGEMSSFVNHEEFKPRGGTYHDVGMIWGLRFLSPSGPFRDDTAPWPGRGEPNRNLVFMTDGEMAPSADIYGMYGIERHDKRIGGGDVSAGGLQAKHNARFRAVCDAARLRGITVWVIAFGQELNDDLKACANRPWQDHAFFAGSDEELKAAFRRIAKQVSSLRVYK